jgi:hypothetical protein
MLEYEIDQKYMETYIAYVTYRLQQHIVDKLETENNQETRS